MPDALTGQAAVGVAARCRARRANSPLSIPSPALLRPRQTAFWRNDSQTTAGRAYGSPSSNTSPLDRSFTRAPAVAPRAWARAAEVGPRQVAPRGASSRTTASWRTSGRRCTARCSEPTAAGVRVIGGVTTSAQPRLDGDGGPKSMKAESRRSNPALDVVRVSDIVST
jgi:hypothetical protein